MCILQSIIQFRPVITYFLKIYHIFFSEVGVDDEDDISSVHEVFSYKLTRVGSTAPPDAPPPAAPVTPTPSTRSRNSFTQPYG